MLRERVARVKGFASSLCSPASLSSLTNGPLLVVATGGAGETPGSGGETTGGGGETAGSAVGTTASGGEAAGSGGETVGSAGETTVRAGDPAGSAVEPTSKGALERTSQREHQEWKASIN